ncbi:MAG: HAMP domain-containing sensor histidine kinase [Stellaceae bacterium]|jgi:signal transduction histidine kinase
MRKPTLTFAVLSAVVMLIAVSVISYAHRLYTINQVGAMAENNNATLAQIIANATLPDFQALTAASEFDSGGDKANPAYADLRSKTLKLIANSPVVRLDILNRDQHAVFSTDPDAIGKISGDEAAFQQAWSGRVGSYMEGGEREIVSSYVPAFDPASPGQVVTVLQIESDVTAYFAELNSYHQRVMLILWVTFAVTYCGLIWIVSSTNRAAARQNEANLRLVAAVARSEAANQSKSDFLAAMSHELRTPLNAIIGFSEIMKSELLGPVAVPAYRDYVTNIHGSGTHLLSIVNDILDMAKTETGNVALDREEFGLKEMLEQTVAMMEERAAAAGLTINLNIAPELGTVVSDKRRIKQVMLNLLSNAIKFTPADGTVTVTARRILNKVALEVADTGIGISEQDLPTAMAPFGQVDSSLARRHEGTGLGLPLAKKFVELLGGTFHIESKPGEGTRVGMTLPVAPPAPGEMPPAETPVRAQPRTKNPTRRFRVAVP